MTSIFETFLQEYSSETVIKIPWCLKKHFLLSKQSPGVSVFRKGAPLVCWVFFAPSSLILMQYDLKRGKSNSVCLRIV